MASLKDPRQRFSFRRWGVNLYAGLLDLLPQSAPIEPSAVVKSLITEIGLSQADVAKIYRIYERLRLLDGRKRRGNVHTLSTSAVINVIQARQAQVEPLLRNILQLGGCYEKVEWDQFIYVFVRLCSLTKVEICQLLFLIIVRELRGFEVHYLTSTQLDMFYENYRKEGTPLSMNCSKIHFSNFPLARYYVTDFIEVCFLYSPLINPLLDLQRQFQHILPSMRFWDRYDFLPGMNRRVTLDFFLIKRSNVSMNSSSTLQETCDLLLLSSEFINERLRRRHTGELEIDDGPQGASIIERWMELDFLANNRKMNSREEAKIDDVFEKMPNEGLIRKEADIGNPV